MADTNDTPTDRPLLTIALSYAADRGWHVFPLHDMASGSCSCGKPDCGTNSGKHPRVSGGFKSASRDPSQITAWWTAWPHANIGVATGPQSNVIMIGPDGEKGREDFAGLVEASGVPFPATGKAASGSGGLHLYYRWPTDGRVVKNRRDHHGTKIDVRGEGGYFVAPHSRNANGPYTWIDDRVELAECPEWLLDWAIRDEMKADRQPVSPPPHQHARPTPTPMGGQWSIESRAIEYLRRCSPAVQHQRGSDKLFWAARVVVYGFDLGVEVGIQILRDHYNPTCSPPWSDKEIRHKCDDANIDNFGKARGWLLLDDREDRQDGGRHLAPRYASPVSVVTVPARPEGAGDPGEAAAGDPLPTHVDTPDNPHRLSHGFLATLPAKTLRHWRSEFFEWRHGAYVSLDDDEIRGRLTAWVRDEFIRVNEIDLAEWNTNGCKGKMPTAIKVTQKTIGDTLNALRSITMLTAAVKPPTWVDGATGPNPRDVIALRNGLLDTTTRRLLPPTSSFFTTNALAFDYIPDAPRPALWHQFLNDLWTDDADPAAFDEPTVSTLQEWFGYMVKSDTSQQKMLFLIGPTRSGKGTIARILGQLVGEQNLAGPTLGSLTGQFGLGPLYGKSVAVISDARLSGRADTAVVVERLLSITGEDAQTVDRKHLRQIDVKLGTRIVIISNELPKLNDASGALVNRMILIRFLKSFLGKEDTNLTDKLTGELPGILLWSLDGLDRLRERGRFIQPPSSAELIQDMSELSSPISSFVRDRIVIDRNGTTSVKDAFAEWKRWCEAHGRDHPGTEQSFGRDLRAAVPTITSTQLRGYDGVRFRTYRGIRLRTSDDDANSADTNAAAHVGHKREADQVSAVDF